MTFTDEQKALFRELAREVLAEFKQEEEKRVSQAILMHAATCRPAQEFRKAKWTIAGALTVVVIVFEVARMVLRV